MGHGDQDPVVRYEWGMRTAKVLGEMGYKVDFKTYKYVYSSTDHSHLSIKRGVCLEVRREMEGRQENEERVC